MHKRRPAEQREGGRLRRRPGGPYGPPGTGKTTYVRKVAEYLGWPLVVLDPSVFAQEGLPLIATVASRVFSQLLELEGTVIFFDEMEALMYTRSDAGGSFEQEFLTTSLQAEQILSHFRAELMDDEEFREEMVGTALG